MELDRRDTELLNNHIAILENKLELAYKGQEDFKRIIKDLEAINQEVMEENKALDDSNDHLIYKNEELNSSINYFVDRIEELKTEIQKLNRTIDLKDQIIQTYRIENAKMFHEIEKLKEDLEEYERIQKVENIKFCKK